MTADAARDGEDATLLAWAAGGAVLAACIDLLVAVVLGLVEAPSDPRLPSARDFALPLGGVALLSFAAGAAAWRNPARTLPLAAAFHAAVAAGGWWYVDRHLGSFPVPLLGALGAHALFAALAMVGAASVRGDAPGRAATKGASAAGAAAENLESVLVAIVFALVIRHFAVEAYKIPTQSMAPTLLGDDPKRGPGDRVLVKKWDAVLGGPERWETWVFRPPLDRTINYVKRAVGFGGETVEIRDGDLYVDGVIARKPPKVREEMWFPVWPSPAVRKPPASAGVPWVGEGFRREGEDGFVVAGATERRLLRFEGSVLDSVLGAGGSRSVGDVRLSFDVEGAEPGTEIVVRIAGRGGPCEVTVAADGTSLVTDRNGRRKVIGSGPVVDGPVESVEVSFSDLALECRINGRVVTPLLECEPLPAGERPTLGVSFGVEKGGATFRGVRLDRDVYYTNQGTTRFEVPEGHVLFFGDNSGHSQDARLWRGYEIVETGGARRTFWSEHPPSERDGSVEFRDRNGVLRSFASTEVRIADSTVPLPYVPLADLHGRAFAIFWPPRGVTKVEGGRVGVLR